MVRCMVEQPSLILSVWSKVIVKKLHVCGRNEKLELGKQWVDSVCVMLLALGKGQRGGRAGKIIWTPGMESPFRLLTSFFRLWISLFPSYGRVYEKPTKTYRMCGSSCEWLARLWLWFGVWKDTNNLDYEFLLLCSSGFIVGSFGRCECGYEVCAFTKKNNEGAKMMFPLLIICDPLPCRDQSMDW